MPWNIDLPTAEFYTLQSSQLDGLVREVIDTPEVAIDTETTGLVSWKDRPLFWSLSWGNRRICMPADTLPAFRAAFADRYKRWVFANAKYDCHMLANVGIEVRGRLVDTQVMHALLYEEQPHNLEHMGKTVLGMTWKGLLDDWNRRKFPSVGDHILHVFETQPSRLIEYASNDAYVTIRLYEKLKAELEAAQTYTLYPGLFGTLWNLFIRTEVPFTKVLWTCERNGLKIDVEYLKSKQAPAQKELENTEREINRLAGFMLNPKSPQQLQDYFFNKLGLKPTKFTKGGKSGRVTASVDASFLENYAGTVPMAKLLLRHRDLEKILGTYIKGVLDRIDPRGYLHTRFNQDVARTGRLSSSDPNMQNWPKPESDEFALRGAVICEPDEEMIVGDYEALEMRLLAAAAGERDMIDIFLRGWDIHMGNASLMYEIPYEDLVLAKKVDKEVKKELDEIAGANLSPLDREAAFAKAHAKMTKYVLKCLTARGDAKCVHPDTLVWSSEGARPIHALDLFSSVPEEFLPADGEVWSGKERCVKVLSTYNGGVQDLVHVVTRRGVLTCTKNHRLVLADDSLVRAGDLKKGMVPKEMEPGELRPVGPYKSSYQKVPIRLTEDTPTLYAAVGHSHAYFAGLYCGDGVKRNNHTVGFSHGSVTKKDELGVSYQEWQNLLMEAASAVGLRPIPSEKGVYLGGRSVTRYLEGLGLIRNGKRALRIPSWVLSAGEDAFLYFLAGLVDTDGTVDGHLSITTKDAVFAGQLAAALQAAGFQLSVDPGWNKTYKRYYYRLRVVIGDAEKLGPYMRHPGKLARLRPRKATRRRAPDEVLVVVEAGRGPCVDISVDSEDHLYIANNFLTHNTIGFGLNYGMKAGKLAGRLGCTKMEAQAKIDKYMATYPAVTHFYDQAIADARRTGYSFTLLGRRRFLPEIVSQNEMERWQAERQAVNTVIQGTAADAAKMAMVNIFESGLLEEYGAKMRSQIHDELIHTCPRTAVGDLKTNKKAMSAIKEMMEHPFPTDLDVPLAVSIGHGVNWLNAK